MNMVAKLTKEERSQFLVSMGSYNNLAKSLYNVQHSFVPENPKDQLELDTTSNWFLYGQSWLGSLAEICCQLGSYL